MADSSFTSTLTLRIAGPDAGETMADENLEDTWENPEAEDIKMPGQDVITTDNVEDDVEK